LLEVTSAGHRRFEGISPPNIIEKHPCSSSSPPQHYESHTPLTSITGSSSLDRKRKSATLADTDTGSASGIDVSRFSEEKKEEAAVRFVNFIKKKYETKPLVFNEFLELLKSYKEKSIDTPGVIEKVRNLFKGCNNLILGFNNFLPEGDENMIKLTPQELSMTPISSSEMDSSATTSTVIADTATNTTTTGAIIDTVSNTSTNSSTQAGAGSGFLSRLLLSLRPVPKHMQAGK
jgi:paired amphipathic helix protein Sin3a